MGMNRKKEDKMRHKQEEPWKDNQGMKEDVKEKWREMVKKKMKE